MTRTKTADNKKSILLFIALMAISFNLRSHITSLPSVIAEIQSVLGLSNAAAGLITSIPVLCFAFLSPVASLLISRLSTAKSAITLLLGISIGIIIRSLGSISAIFIGTVILGFSLTIGNILCLMIIAEFFPDKRNMITGLYVSAMSVSSMITSAGTAPIANALGWQLSLSIWAIIPIASVVFWIVLSFSMQEQAKNTDADTKEQTGRKTIKPVWKRFSAYLLAIAFGAHTSMFYGFTAWLPSYLMSSLGMNRSDAGFSASIFQVAGLIGCFGVPALAYAFKLNRKTQFVIVTLCWFLMPVGLLLFPHYWLIWTIFGGAGSGSGFTVIFGQVMDHAVDMDDNRSISSFVQGIGYFFAAISPTLLGKMNELSGTWITCFITLAIAAVVMAGCGIWSTLLSKKQ